MLFAVVQQPKLKYQDTYVTTILFVDDKNRTKAISNCVRNNPAHIYKAPYAVEVKHGVLLRI